MAGGRARTSLRALRNRPWRAEPDGLGPLRQLGWTTALWLRPDAVLLAHALHRVHTEPGHPSFAVLHGAWLPLFRRRDRERAHRSNEDRADRSKRRRAALQPEVSAVRRLLRLRAPRLPPLPAGNQGQDRVDRAFRQAELLAGDLLPLAAGPEPAGSHLDGKDQSPGALHHARGSLPAVASRSACCSSTNSPITTPATWKIAAWPR